MENYDASTYGDRFADVYDAWYPAGDETEPCVAALAALTPTAGALLELGVGTGRLAIPLAGRGLAVTGLDASGAMLERLEAKPGSDAVTAVTGDMAGPLPDGPFDLVVVAKNTFFALTTEADQRRCAAEVARVLAPGGRFVVEAFVPTDEDAPRSSVEVRSIDADSVLLFVDRLDRVTQEAWSSFVEITPTGVRFRPTHVRWQTPEQLDSLLAGVGLVLERRWATWAQDPFDDDATHHISIYGRAPAGAVNPDAPPGP